MSLSAIPDSSLATSLRPNPEEKETQELLKKTKALLKKTEEELKIKKKELKAAQAAETMNIYFFKLFESERIRISNYDKNRESLTIQYPTFDFKKKEDKENFIKNFSNFCNRIIKYEIPKTEEIEREKKAAIEAGKDVDEETAKKAGEKMCKIISINIEFYESKPPNNICEPSDRILTRARNLTSTAVEEMSKKIYDGCLAMYDDYKDVEDDLNSPKQGERLQIAMDGAYLLFFLNPKGSLPKRSFAPTGHGGRNAFLHFKNKISNDEFLCGGIMSRNRAINQGEGVFNCFGGSPDYDENIQITIIREMLEEMFETLFRDPRVIKPEAEQTEDYKNAIKLLNEILGQEQTIDPLDQFISNLHTNCDLQFEERFKQVVLTESFNKINWNGLGFPDHTLSTGEKVLSLTTYYLPNQKIETQFSAEQVAEIVMTNYAKTELNGVFVLKKTENYKKFFTEFDAVVMEQIKTIEKKETFKEKIDNILTAANDKTIDFLYISYGTTLYKTNFKFSSDIEEPYTLVVKIHHTDPDNTDQKFNIIFLKIGLNNQFQPNIELLDKKGITPFYMNKGGSETYYMLKYINDKPDPDPVPVSVPVLDSAPE
jgi:hypothetical protein